MPSKLPLLSKAYEGAEGDQPRTATISEDAIPAVLAEAQELIDSEQRSISHFPELLEGEEPKQEIQQVLREARSAYIRGLKSKGVHKKYLRELRYVTPSRAIRYLTDERVTKAIPFVDDETQSKDLSRTQIQITKDFVAGFMHVLSTELPETDAKDIREVVLHYLTYHELTHSLQKAFLYLHRGSQAMVAVPMSLQEPQDPRIGISSRTIKEKQAEGIALDLLTGFISTHPSSAKLKAIPNILLNQRKKYVPDIRELRSAIRDNKKQPFQHVAIEYAIMDLIESEGELSDEEKESLRGIIKGNPMQHVRGIAFPARKKVLDRLYNLLSVKP